jgi:hypothetical protein
VVILGDEDPPHRALHSPPSISVRIESSLRLESSASASLTPGMNPAVQTPLSARKTVSPVKR